MVQIVPLVPEVSAPQAQVDPNIKLLDVLQNLINNNKPSDNVSQATPDQIAAAAANSKPSPALPDGKKADTKADKNAYGGATLPDVLSMLGINLGSNPADNAAAAQQNAQSSAPAANTSGGTITQLRNSLKDGNLDSTKIGSAVNNAVDIGSKLLAFL